MPHCEKSKTKTKVDCNTKCEKSCESSSSETSKCCYVDQKLDCCTSQYQRLARLLTLSTLPSYITSQAYPAPTIVGGADTVYFNFTRAGAPITTPNDVTAIPGDNLLAGAYWLAAQGASVDYTTTALQTAYTAYYWVNTLRYLTYEPACQNDQVWGWYVDTLTQNLQLFQETDGIPTNIVRADVLAYVAPLTTQQKRQTKVLNNLYKLSLKALKEVNGVPRQEGNIVKVSDKCGQKWLLSVNFANPNTSGSGIFTAPQNQQFVFVACKL